MDVTSFYAEYPMPGPFARCRWEQRVGPQAYVQRVLPDACADLVVRSDGRASLVGPATSVQLPRLAAGTRIQGLRLRTAAIGAAFRLPADELRDEEIPLDALVGDAAARRIAELVWHGEAPDPPDRAPDPRVEHALGALGRPGSRVAAVAGYVGTSERHLRRLLLAHTGLDPRMFQRVARFQRFLRLSDHADRSLAGLAARAGYADQAHLTREVRALAGLTPSALLAERRRPC